MNIALMGFRGTEKSAICRLLAKKLDKKLISTYEEISKKTNIGIGKFLKKHGLDKFNDLVSEVIEKLSDLDDCIFDASCGDLLRNENIINMKKNSLLILLTADIKKTTRSNAKEKPSPERYYYADEKYFLPEHELKYKKSADYIIDTSSLSPEEVCDLIIHYVQAEVQ